jgi:membrane-bound lytic murein transglycosylase B
VAHHRLIRDAARPSLVLRLTAIIIWPLRFIRSTHPRQGIVRHSGARGTVVATITPLVLACAAAGAAPRFLTPTIAAPAPVTYSVAAVSPTRNGPAVVTVQRRPAGEYIVAAGSSPPSIESANSPTDQHSSAADSSPPSIELANSVNALGIPPIALSAYRNAEQKMATSDPGCGIGWTLLAGIGRIESGHANGGATDSHGTAVQPIYGPVLDGTLPGNETIVQSSVGKNVTYARAIGPMQFLPGTWARYASDGDGDGVADPQNLYDSTLAAARYLCSGGLNLRESSAVMAAILRYNNSTPYARSVLGWAAAYATGVAPMDLPPVTGPAPPLGDLHLENPEGLGPGLPLNIHGLPSTDPLAQMPLIDFGQPAMPGPQPIWPSQPVVPHSPGCTVICIEPQTATTQ